MKIILSKTYLKNLNKLLDYLNKVWGLKVSKNFIIEIDKRIITISHQPNTGLRSQKSKKIRSILISKQNRLFYKIEKETIVILDLKDTRTNPTKTKY